MRIVMLAAFFVSCSDARSLAQSRPCVACGGFYTADSGQLSAEVAGYLRKDSSGVKTQGPVYGLLVPHAGYHYSGKIAAEAYARLTGDYDVVAVIGTAHYVPVKAAALMKGAFETPLGAVPVDGELADKLAQDKELFEIQPEAHAREHSVEVQLPFLIKKLKKPFKILPIVLNTGDYDTAAKIGAALGRALAGRKALVVVSTDFSHYPPADTARISDLSALAALESMDSRYFFLANAALMSVRPAGLECVACGEAAVIAGMEAVKQMGANRAYVLKYANSGELTGDGKRSVGYAAAVFSAAKTSASLKWDLTGKEKSELVSLAQNAVRSHMAQKPVPAALSADTKFNLPAAVFVTITRNGALRGCMGATEPRGTLLNSVQYFAQAAAFMDGRFEPVTETELPELRYEISILSPPEPVRSFNDIQPKINGVIVERDGHSGLFLPQVWEQLPVKSEFMSELCSQKANLDRDCWKDPKTKLYVFTVYSFK